jgi:hypothetical protein
LKNIYRNTDNGHKINLIQPPLALGQIVHDVIDSLSFLPVEKRTLVSLKDIYNKFWTNISGKRGGFKSEKEEIDYKNQGIKMLERIEENPGPLKNKAIKIRQNLPYFWLDEEENIILCGKVDWLEYVENDDSVRIIDFKTGKYDEDPDSLQLPIYYLLVTNCQAKKVSGISYWYLQRDDEPIDQEIPSYQNAQDRILEIAKKIVLARKLNRFVCKKPNGCMFCEPYEKILQGKAEYIYTNSYKQDIYIL